MEKEFAGVKTNDEYQYMNAPDEELPSVAKTKLILAITKGEVSFEAKDVTYDLLKEGHDFYRVGMKTQAGTFTVKDGKAEGADASVADALSQAVADGISSFEAGDTAYYFELDGNNGTLYSVEPITVATKQIFATAAEDTKLDYEFKFNAERAMNGTADSFMAGGKTYTIERTEGEDGSVSAVFYDEAGAEYATASRFTMNAIGEGVFLTGEFRAAAEAAIEANESQFEFTEEDGTQSTYYVKRDDNQWIIKKTTETHVSSTFASPSKEHLLGTDGNGMDMLTRLMYGGRISLMVGFVVVFAEVLIGVVLGGIAGYFGGWLDNLIMRLVDIFNCIPAAAAVYYHWLYFRFHSAGPDDTSICPDAYFVTCTVAGICPSCTRSDSFFKRAGIYDCNRGDRHQHFQKNFCTLDSKRYASGYRYGNNESWLYNSF